MYWCFSRQVTVTDIQMCEWVSVSNVSGGHTHVYTDARQDDASLEWRAHGSKEANEGTDHHSDTCEAHGRCVGKTGSQKWGRCAVGPLFTLVTVTGWCGLACAAASAAAAAASFSWLRLQSVVITPRTRPPPPPPPSLHAGKKSSVVTWSSVRVETKNESLGHTHAARSAKNLSEHRLHEVHGQHCNESYARSLTNDYTKCGVKLK